MKGSQDSSGLRVLALCVFFREFAFRECQVVVGYGRRRDISLSLSLAREIVAL